MKKHNFIPFPFEWWHFDYAGWENYPPLDISFESLGRGVRTTVPVRMMRTLAADETFPSPTEAIEVGCRPMPNGSHFSDPIYSDPLFQMAKRQFEVIADYLDIRGG